jgi:hypothetical protein
MNGGDRGNDDELALLEDWLAVLARHPRLHWRSMRSLLGSAPGAVHTSKRHKPASDMALGEAFNF